MSTPAPRPFSQFLLDHNPLYLLSAALMLLGCYLLTGALDVRAGQLGKLLALLLTLNAYEFLLLGLAGYLWQRRALQRDARILLLIEALFLVDLTFLNGEAASISAAAGAAVNGVMLALAALKYLLARRFLGRSLPHSAFLFVLLTILAALPVIFRLLSHNGELSPRPYYLLWWIIGLLPVLFDVLRRLFPHTAPSGIRSTWLTLAYLSLIAHAGFQHWVYDAHFYVACVAPVLLGLLVIAPRLPRWVGRVGQTRVVLTVLALLLGATSPPELALLVPGTTTTLSPGLLTCAGAALAWAYCLSLPALAWTTGGLALLALLRLFGPRPEQVVNFADLCLQRMLALLHRGLPSTPAGWGLVAIVSAFVTLALGALLSLRRHRVPEGRDENSPAL